MTPRPGRRQGRTLLNARQADARRRAIAKLDRLRAVRLVEERMPPTLFISDVIFGRPPRPPAPPFLTVPLELPGHHLQRAAAENA